MYIEICKHSECLKSEREVFELTEDCQKRCIKTYVCSPFLISVNIKQHVKFESVRNFDHNQGFLINFFFSLQLRFLVPW